MQRLRTYLIFFAIVAGAVSLAFDTGGSGVPEDTPQVITEKQVVTVKTIKAKKKKVFVKKFTPRARPNKRQTLQIIKIEGKQWHMSKAEQSRLACRINGESSFEWNQTTGQYQGLGQFASETFARGMRSIGTRQIRYVYKEKKKTTYDKTITTYSDGSTSYKKINPRKTTYVYIMKGMIPANPPRTHGHAQVRIMARALKGLGAVHNSEWAVQC